MFPSALVARFRSDVDDDQVPYLWTDDEVWGYVNDAHSKWVRGIGGIRDASTTAIVELAITDGDPWLELDARIMHIRSARLVSTGKSLPVLSWEDLGRQGMTSAPWPVSLADLDTDGAVSALIIGMEDGKLRTSRIPTAADTIKLVVERLPLNTLAAPAASAAPAAVTSITQAAGIATVTTTAPHGRVGQFSVTLAGADQADYVGTFTARTAGASTFQIDVDSEATTPATGTITWAPAAEYPFEVRAEYHLDLLWWLKHLAYSKQDADTFNKEKADEAAGKFALLLREAKHEKERLGHRPGLIAYGG